MHQNTMRKLIVSEWVTLDGVFDADTMDQWWSPYDSVQRQEYIKEGMGMTKLKLVESKTLSLGVVLLPYQPVKK